MEFYNVMVCTDCYWVHHFGNIGDEAMEFGLYDPVTGHQSMGLAESRNAECVAAYMRLGGDRYVSDNTNANDENGDGDTGIDEFSWSPCHCCGSHLGGSRYRLAVEDHVS